MSDVLKPGPDFMAIAKRLIFEVKEADDHCEWMIGGWEGQAEGNIPFTVFDDFTVVIGNRDNYNGVIGSGSATDASLLAEEILHTAAMLDYDHEEMTTPLKIDGAS